jgi:hypothetical protein
LEKLLIARPSEPSSLKSAQSMPIAPRVAPDWSKAIPEVIPTSSNLPPPRLWKRKLGTVSLATARSTRPSSSMS